MLYSADSSALFVKIKLSNLGVQSAVTQLQLVDPVGIEGMLVRVSDCRRSRWIVVCVLEQDTAYIVMVQPRKTCPDMTEKLLTGM